ncbi:MAG: helix-hairpin-helix domain-containing protein [Candidatus Heimdallarchaeaceae archaeon]|jgi:transcription termination factor NusA
MFGIYLEGLRQAEDLMEKGEHEQALHEINLLEKGVELDETEKLACMLLTSQIMNRSGHFEKSLMLSKFAFRKSMDLEDPLLVVDSTISFLESISGLGVLFDASNKEIKEFTQMIERSEEILKTIQKLSEKGREIRTDSLTNLKGIIQHSEIKKVPSKEEPKKEIPFVPVDKVKGVGQKAATLKEVGIKSATDLAYSKPKDLVTIKGIGEASAKKLIAAAKELIEG